MKPMDAPPFGQSFLSAAVRIGSLAVRMAAFSCAWSGVLTSTPMGILGAVTSIMLRSIVSIPCKPLSH